jgi:hypothetical protein
MVLFLGVRATSLQHYTTAIGKSRVTACKPPAAREKVFNVKTRKIQPIKWFQRRPAGS